MIDQVTGRQIQAIENSWISTDLWERKRTPLVHQEALEIMRRDTEFKWVWDVKFEAQDPFLDRGIRRCWRSCSSG